jgi:alkaline phosphatase D
MHVRVAGRTVSTRVTASTDDAGSILVRRLRPGTRYGYSVWFDAAGGRSKTATGSFRTAPSTGSRRPVGLVFSGDLGGLGYCRPLDTGGYAIFDAMRALRPDFFVADGDMVYADDTCPYLAPDGRPNVAAALPNVAFDVPWTSPRKLLAAYMAHWRYNRLDPYFKRFLAGTPIYSAWDDHEVINDFGAAWPEYPPNPTKPGYTNLVRAGRQAYLAYAAMRPGPMYRSFRWGGDVELFVLDGRSYRSRDDLPDTAQNAKTLLGAAQLAWLERGLARSTATWKIVVSDVTLSIGSGTAAARDGWANTGGKTGFERELLSLLSFLDARDVRNVVFLATDVHSTEFLRHVKDFDGDGDELTFWELVTGPLAADRNLPGALDPTTAPQSLFAEGGIPAFAYVRTAPGADGRTHLRVDARGESGRVLPNSALDLAPR